MDEFFQIRVAGLQEQVQAEVPSSAPDGATPAQQLRDIRAFVEHLSDRQEKPQFVLVLFHVASDPPVSASTLQHLGFALGSREEVDSAAAAARADGVLMADPVYAGPIVGYFCLLSDPDGNPVEFSYGQPIDPTGLTSRQEPSVP